LVGKAEKERATTTTTRDERVNDDERKKTKECDGVGGDDDAVHQKDIRILQRHKGCKGPGVKEVARKSCLNEHKEMKRDGKCR
jgi:hypothetical protein